MSMVVFSPTEFFVDQCCGAEQLRVIGPVLRPIVANDLPNSYYILLWMSGKIHRFNSEQTEPASWSQPEQRRRWAREPWCGDSGGGTAYTQVKVRANLNNQWGWFCNLN
jgi:hypothetical protein